MSNDWEEKLGVLGLGEREARVYLALLKHGRAVVQRVAESAGIHRVTCYDVLDRLIEKGFAKVNDERKTKYYQPVPLERLLKRHQQEVSELKQVVPEINAQASPYVHPATVKIVRGKKGLRQALEDTLESQTEICWLVNPPDNPKHRNYNFRLELSRNYIPRRTELGIRSRGLYVRKPLSYLAKIRSERWLREIVFLPGENILEDHEMAIYDNKIVHFMYHTDQVYGSIIEDAALADVQRTMFNWLWEYSLQFDQTIPESFDAEVLTSLLPEDAV